MGWITTRFQEPILTENRHRTFTLCDSTFDSIVHTGLVYSWNGYAEDESVRSLLRYVETNSERLRRKYLAWIHELGETRIDGKRLIDHLAFEDGLSYWWMTLFAEKSPWKSPSIINAIRLFALEEIVVQQRPGKLRLISAYRQLHEAVSGLCQRLGIDYEWERPVVERRRSMGIRSVYEILPQPVQGVISLARHLLTRRPLKRTEKSGWFCGDQTLFFCSYFFNVAPDLAKDGHFHSRYWEGLHQLMQSMGIRGNWLQLYVPHAAVPSPEVAMGLTRGFNRYRQEEGFHAFLDAYLSWHIVLQVLKRWLWLNLMFWRLRKVKYAFHPLGSWFSLWPFMQRDWKASMCGSAAISNLLWIELFDVALRDLPHQTKGLYLCENQAWERALIHAWRKHGHGCLIAVAHSTVRFWDLRYFADPHTLLPGPCPLPQPDIIALNGKAAVDAYLSVGYPQDAIVECEALRYGYLANIHVEQFGAEVTGRGLRVLVLGDYVPSATDKLLKLLQATAPRMPPGTSYTVKPHPNCFVRADEYPALNLQVTTEPLGGILGAFDVAYAGNLTSASVDAYLAGLPVVVVLDETELNFSPLRGQPNVRFASTPEELAKALQSTNGAAKGLMRNEFFFLDPELPRWEKLLQA
jgi:surface carbohydrate biosynthesis protein (TIGR04326 family)